MKHWHLFLLILFVGIFLRTYQIVDRFEYGHDGDLYSWIVRDIVIDHHPRLIGQLTSAPGVYIGGFFYYLISPFMLLTNLDPIGALIPVTLLGIATMVGYYWVFSKLFNKNVGLIAMFLDGVLLSSVGVDRWVVPTVLTNAWTLLYLYSLINLVRGSFKQLWILGILLGLIWHVHIAIIPSLIAIPVAIFLSKKLPSLKQFGLFVVAALISNLPLLIFEIKHHFSQTLSIISNFGVNHGGGVGWEKLELNYIKLSRIIIDFLFYPQSPAIDYKIIAGIFLISGIFLFKTKLISVKETIVLSSWFLGSLVFFSLTSTIVSEYYFSNLNILYIVIASFWMTYLYQKNMILKIMIIIIMFIVVTKNLIYFINQEPYQNTYTQKKEVIEFIAKDSKEKGYPCVSISYITTPGNNFGFRQMIYLNNLHVNQPSSGSPTYSIVVPFSIVRDSLDFKSGVIGVLTPKEVKTKEEINYSCSGQNSNLTDPLFGYSE